MNDTASPTAMLSWADDHSYINKFGSREYSPFVCHILNLFDRRSHDRRCACEWVAPYGFVPEAGCQQHD